MTLAAPIHRILADRGALPERVRVIHGTVAFRAGDVLSWCPVRRAFQGRAGYCALAEQVRRHWGKVYDHAPAEQARLAI